MPIRGKRKSRNAACSAQQGQQVAPTWVPSSAKKRVVYQRSQRSLKTITTMQHMHLRMLHPAPCQHGQQRSVGGTSRRPKWTASHPVLCAQRRAPFSPIYSPLVLRMQQMGPCVSDRDLGRVTTVRRQHHIGQSTIDLSRIRHLYRVFLPRRVVGPRILRISLLHQGQPRQAEEDPSRSRRLFVQVRVVIHTTSMRCLYLLWIQMPVVLVLLPPIHRLLQVGFIICILYGISTTTGLPSTPIRRPPEVISRIQANSGRRRRSMSVGDTEWNTIISPQSASKIPASTQNRAPSPSPASNTLAKPRDKQRPVSANSTSSSGYTTARSDTTPVGSPLASTSPEAEERVVHTIRPSRDWKNALEGWDHQVASLEIKDPSVSPSLGSPLSGDSLGSPTTPSKVRPRSRTQDPMPIPPRLSLGKQNSPGTPTRAGSVGSPPKGFSLPPDSASSISSIATSNSGTARSPSFSLYSTPPSGPPSASPSFSAQQAMHVTPTRRGSAAAAVPFTGPVIIGTTPATIGHTKTKVTIQRDQDDHQTATPIKPSTSPSGSTSPSSSPITPHSVQAGQRRSSSSHRSTSPQLQPPSAAVQAAINVGRAAGTSLRVSSLRGTPRPALNIMGTPSTSPSNNAGTLRATVSPARNETYSGHGSPKISLSLTSPSQENLRHGGGATGSSGYGARPNELRAIYGLKNPASASEPTLLPPGASGVDESMKTIRLITSGSRLGSAGGRGGEFGEAGELGGTRLSSPTSSVKHNFSNASRSSVSRDGSAGTTNGSGSILAAEEVEGQAETIARRIWDEDETFRGKERFAEWLGRP